MVLLLLYTGIWPSVSPKFGCGPGGFLEPDPGGSQSLKSWKYICKAVPDCFMLEMQFAICAFRFALANAGNNMAARMAIMAMTTSSSIKVKPRVFLEVARTIIKNKVY